MRNDLFFELCFLPPVVKVTTSLDMEYNYLVFSSKERPTGLLRTFSNAFLGDLAWSARLWGMMVNHVTCHGLMKSPCSKMQRSSTKLLGTPAAILVGASVICTRGFKVGNRIGILGHCLCNHRTVPSILEGRHAVPASSAQGQGKQQGTCSSLRGGHPCLGPCEYSRNHQSFMAFQDCTLTN